MKQERIEEKFEIQPNLQTKESINTNEGGKKIKENFLNIFKEESGNMIIKMHYVGHFIV